MTASDRFSVERVEFGGGTALGLLDRDRPKQRPIIVDFESAGLQFRSRNGVNGELIVKSFGQAPTERSEKLIVDASAGFGTDAFLLALAGYQVLAVEREPLVFQVLKDGWDRLQRAGGLAVAGQLGGFALKFSVVLGDAREVLKRMEGTAGRPFGVYFDPMFEMDSRKSKSLPRKEMAILQELTRKTMHPLEVEGADAASVLSRALLTATDRVIVKRPIGASPLLVDSSPANRLEGKVAGFDIYSCRVGKTRQ